MFLNRPLTATTAAALIALLAAPQIALAEAQADAAEPAAQAQAGAPAAQAAAQAQADAPAAQAATQAQASAQPATVQAAPTGDLVETAKAAGQFTIFLKALDDTNLTQVLKTYKDLTVFAPTDAAFEALPAGELDALLKDKQGLQKLLTYHIINAPVDSSKIQGAKGPVATVAGDPVLLDGVGDALKVENATIVRADVRASNGILHVVDAVLKPGSVPPAAEEAAEAPSGETAEASPTAAAEAETTAAPGN